MYDLTGFQRDLLYVIAGEDEPTDWRSKMNSNSTTRRRSITVGSIPISTPSSTRGSSKGPPRSSNELLHAHPPRSPRTRSPPRVGDTVRRAVAVRRAVSRSPRSVAPMIAVRNVRLYNREPSVSYRRPRLFSVRPIDDTVAASLPVGSRRRIRRLTRPTVGRSLIYDHGERSGVNEVALQVADAPLEETVVRIALAGALGMFLGLEREWSQKSAGIRTFSLISLLAAVFTVLVVETEGVIGESLLVLGGVLVIVQGVLLAIQGLMSEGRRRALADDVGLDARRLRGRRAGHRRLHSRGGHRRRPLVAVARLEARAPRVRVGALPSGDALDDRVRHPRVRHLPDSPC